MPAVGQKKWFDGYDQQEVAIFDDYGGDGYLFRLCDVLRLTHSWTETCENKGGMTPWTPRVVIFTSNYHPKIWYRLQADIQKRYKDRSISYTAFAMRFTKVMYFTKDIEGIYSHESLTDSEEILSFFFDKENFYDTQLQEPTYDARPGYSLNPLYHKQY